MADETKSEQALESEVSDKKNNHVESIAGSGESGKNGSDIQDEKTNIEEMKKKASQLLLLGKRNILIQDFQAAVSDLATSCELFKVVYGEQSDEMGDPYFYYGKALFELARNESEVLGDQVQDQKEDDDDDDEEEEEEAEAEAEVVAEPEDEEDDDDDDDEKGKEKEKETIDSEDNKMILEESSINKNDKPDEVKKDEKVLDGGVEVIGEESEEVNDLQLSWEFLELAKVIYQRNADKCKDTAIKLSEVYLLLGENGLESENYGTAIEDMKQALELQQKVLPEEDRRIAETYYHLGVAHSLFTKFDEAVTYFKAAIAQLEKKIASLEARKKAGDKKTADEEKDAFYTMDGEIESIRSIITDINDKISDMNDYKNEIKTEALKQVLSGGCQSGASTSASNGESAGTCSSSSVPVTDISHLVRKKRKNEDEEEHSAKKAKQDNGV